MRELLWIGLGGFLGANARWLVYRVVGGAVPGLFPWATVTVNVAGCFLIGILMGLVEATAPLPSLRPIMIVGFLGSFTTFSTFGWETISLLERGFLGTALTYVLTNVVVGLAATGAGLLAGRALG